MTHPVPQAEPLPLEAGARWLPGELCAPVAPTAVRAPRLLRLNRPLAHELGLDPETLASPEGVAALAGSRVPTGLRPVALAYAGHQFGRFVPRLGDGRAVLLGEREGRDGARRELQLKGSGRTPFSRAGDGRAALGPVLREYIVSEAMAALGVPTTRSLAVVATGERVFREEALPGAVLARVAASHVRVGSFEYLYRLGNAGALRRLADAVIARHYPEAAAAERPYEALLEAVAERTAELVARWMEVGFIHGVMNTDNLQVAGETLDYGPCAFMDAYHPATVYSSIDAAGRYAYDRQPSVAHWNLAVFAETLVPLLAEREEEALERARAALDRYAERFEEAHGAGLRAKIGLAAPREGDLELARDLLARMAEQRADFTLTFRRLSELSGGGPRHDGPARALFADPAAFDAWAERWRKRLAAEARPEAERRAALRAANPAFVPRNHRVQQAVDAAEREGDPGPAERLLEVLARPYEDQPERAEYAEPPRPGEEVRRTFCGT